MPKIPLFAVLVGFFLIGQIDINAADYSSWTEPKSKISLNVVTTKGSLLKGKVAAYSSAGIKLDQSGKQVILTWDQVRPNMVYPIMRRVFPPRDGEAYLMMAKQLLKLDGQTKEVKAALKRAVQLDKGLKQKADILGEAGGDRVSATRQVTRDAKDETKKNKASWGQMSEEAQQAAVDKIKAFADKAMKKAGTPLKLVETKYFLFYSDLSSTEVRKWTSLLDKLYATLAKAFGMERGQNIWHGKALVMVFQKESDWQQIERTAFNFNPPKGSAGLCHTSSAGPVYITFFRQSSDAFFARVLVHETTHGFIHRYRSPVHLPSWMNEGLAEMYEAALVNQGGWVNHQRKRTRDMLLKRRRIGTGFWTKTNIDFEDYGVAAGFMDFLYKLSSKKFVAFLRAVKDGTPWQQSLEESYKLSLDKLVGTYGQVIKVPGLQP